MYVRLYACTCVRVWGRRLGRGKEHGCFQVFSCSVIVVQLFDRSSHTTMYLTDMCTQTLYSRRTSVVTSVVHLTLDGVNGK